MVGDNTYHGRHHPRSLAGLIAGDNTSNGLLADAGVITNIIFF
jgi:hypothetical protein